MDRASHESIVNQQIDSAMAAMFPHGAGQTINTRAEYHLRQIAHVAFEQGRSYALMSLLTVQDVAAHFGISERRVRALLKARNARFSIGYQVPGTNQWLITPEEVATLQPGPNGRPKRTDA